jgi:putative flippase GtrA
VLTIASILLSGIVDRQGAGVLRQLLFFLSAGALATALHYAVLFLLVGRGAGPVGASTLGALLGALANYTLNRRFTFRSQRAHHAALPRYFIVAASGVALNAALLKAFLPVLSHYLTAQLGATAVVLLWNFTLNRRWTFRGSRYAQ